jgi:hypothetical protein
MFGSSATRKKSPWARRNKIHTHFFSTHYGTDNDGKTAFVLAKEKAAAIEEGHVLYFQTKALPASMSKWIAAKNWRLLRL